MDLVGRKLRLDGGGVVAEFLVADRHARPRARCAAGPDLAIIRANLAEALTAAGRHDQLGHAQGRRSDPRNALAGATPYLRMFSLVTRGWLMARAALGGASALDAGPKDDARGGVPAGQGRHRPFFCEQILPGSRAQVAAVRAGHEALLAVPVTSSDRGHDHLVTGGLIGRRLRRRRAVGLASPAMHWILSAIPAPGSGDEPWGQ